MVRGKLTSPELQEKVLKKKEEGKSIQEISRELLMSKNSVKDIFYRNKVKNERNVKKKLGRKEKISPRQKRIIKREVKKNKTITARKLIETFDLNVNETTVSRTLKREKFVRKKLKKKPSLNDRHKENRKKFAWDHYRYHEWNDFFFTDEKKFNLDGPDGYNYYWHCLDDKDISFSKSPFSKKGVMVWGAVSSNYGVCFSLFDNINVTSKVYIGMLEKDFLPFVQNIEEELPGLNWTFLQDNCSVHTSLETRQWFNLQGFDVLNIPAKSPDINIIENIWAWLVRKIYEGGKLYNNLNELKEAILYWSYNIPVEVIENHVNSMDRRLKEIIEKNGGQTKY